MKIHEIVGAALDMLGEATRKSKAAILQANAVDLWSIMKMKFGEPVGVGRYRAVWGNKQYVFKLPINSHGWNDNVKEYRAFQANKGKSLAKCRIIYVRTVPILVMERIAFMDFKDQPEWASRVDSRQVGLSRSGRPVAFDYARSDDVDDLPEGMAAGQGMLGESVEPFVLYHGTSESPETIRREGLKADRHGAVFLTDNPQLAGEYAETDQERSGSDFITVVSVDANQLDQSLLVGDLDHTLTDDWQESLRDTDQCMYRSDIPPHLLLKVEDYSD